MSDLTHFDDQGQAHMVDVSQKPQSEREAKAQASITMNETAFEAVRAGTSKKGDVLGVARISGIQAAKKTSDLIPLCHPLMISKVSVEFTLMEESRRIDILSTVKTTGQTGVEMEALTAASTAALTIYDMLKAVDQNMEITNISVVEKKGGRSGHYIATK